MKPVPNSVFSFALKIALFNDSAAFRLDSYKLFYNLDLYGKAFAIAQKLKNRNLDYDQYSALNLLPNGYLDKSYKFYKKIELSESFINLYQVLKEFYSETVSIKFFGCPYLAYKENRISSELELECNT